LSAGTARGWVLRSNLASHIDCTISRLLSNRCAIPLLPVVTSSERPLHPADQVFATRRRFAHTAAFRAEERLFVEYEQAERFLKDLARRSP